MSLLGVAAQGLCRLASNVVIGRIAGVDALGEIGTITAIAFACALVGPTAFGPAVSKFVGLSHGAGDAHRALRLLRVLHFYGLVVTALAAGAAGAWACSSLSPTDGAYTAFLAAAAGTYGMARSTAFVTEQVWRGTLLEVGGSVLAFVTVPLLMHAGARGGVLVLPQVVAMGAYVMYFLRPRVGGTTGIREIIEFVVLATIGSIASAGTLQATVLLARWEGGTEAAGFMSAAFAVCTPLTFVASAATSAIYPRLAKDVGAQALSQARSLSRQTAGLLALILGAPFSILALLSEPLVVAVWGPSFRPSSTLILPGLAAILATCIASPEVALLTASSRKGVRLSTLASLGGAGVALLPWAYALVTPGGQLQYLMGGYLVSMLGTAVAASVIASGWRSTSWITMIASVGVILALGSVAANTSLTTRTLLAALIAIGGAVLILRRIRGTVTRPSRLT